MRHRDFVDPRAEPNGLGDDLLVEDEIIRVKKKGRGFQETPAKSAKAGMIFRELEAKDPVLAPGEETIGKTLVKGMPPVTA